jgi:hypothetical protein
MAGKALVSPRNTTTFYSDFTVVGKVIVSCGKQIVTSGVSHNIVSSIYILLYATISRQIRHTTAAIAHIILIQGPEKKKLSTITPIMTHMATTATRAAVDDLFTKGYR